MALSTVGFPGGSDSIESAHDAGDPGLIPGLGRSPGEGNGYALQYSGLENSMDCVVHRVPKSWTRLSDFHFHFHGALIFELVLTQAVCAALSRPRLSPDG